MNEKVNIIQEKSLNFGVRIVKLYKYLTSTHKEYPLFMQILKSGTSIGANVREALNAESTADFIHKFAIAQKECDETIHWLILFHRTDYISTSEFESLNKDAVELLKIIRSIIITSKKNTKGSRNS